MQRVVGVSSLGTWDAVQAYRVSPQRTGSNFDLALRLEETSPAEWRAAFYTRDGGLTLLAEPPLGSQFAEATAINDNDKRAGRSDEDGSPIGPATWSAANVANLFTLGSRDVGIALDVNNSGTTVGWAEGTNSPRSAWKQADGAQAGLLPSSPYSVSEARCVSESGWVGGQLISGDSDSPPVLWKPDGTTIVNIANDASWESGRTGYVADMVEFSNGGDSYVIAVGYVAAKGLLRGYPFLYKVKTTGTQTTELLKVQYSDLGPPTQAALTTALDSVMFVGTTSGGLVPYIWQGNPLNLTDTLKQGFACDLNAVCNPDQPEAAAGTTFGTGVNSSGHIGGKDWGTNKVYFTKADAQGWTYGGVTNATKVRGTEMGGSEAGTRGPNGAYWALGNAIVANPTVPPVEVEVPADLEGGVSSKLCVRVTSRVREAGVFSQKVLLWNFSTQAFDVVRTDTVGTMAKTRFAIVTTNLSDYVQNDTAIARLQYFKSGPGGTSDPDWTVEIEQVNFVRQ